MLMAGGKGKLYPAFWGYLVHDGATLLTSSWLEKSQLPVVLDLDETLIVAHSASKLQQEIGKLRHSRYKPALIVPLVYHVPRSLLPFVHALTLSLTDCEIVYKSCFQIACIAHRASHC